MKMMRSIVKGMLIGVFTLIYINVNAQDEEITDDELMRYAKVMDTVQVLSGKIKDYISESVSNSEHITGARYNELYKIIDNEEKLKESSATDEEIEFITQLNSTTDSMKAAVNDLFKTMAKDYIGDGGRVYNKIKKALKSDEAVKERYDAIIEKINEDKIESEEKTEDSK